MNRILSALVLAMTLTACEPGADPGAALARDAAQNIPDSWNCATLVWDNGAARTLGDDSFLVEPGLQTSGTARMYHPIDGAFDSIATVKDWGNYFTWTSSVPIRAIITSAGPGKHIVYDYRPGRTAGYGVAAADATQTYYPESLLFCFDAPGDVCAPAN